MSARDAMRHERRVNACASRGLPGREAAKVPGVSSCSGSVSEAVTAATRSC